MQAHELITRVLGLFSRSVSCRTIMSAVLFGLSAGSIADPIEAGLFTQNNLRECVVDPGPGCVGVDPSIWIDSDFDLATTGVVSTQIVESPGIESATAAGYLGNALTPAISLYAYTTDPNLARRFTVGSFGVQRYTFIDDGTITITGTLTYSQSGQAASPLDANGQIVRANFYAFEMEDDVLDPTNCSGLNDVSQWNASGFLGACLLGQYGTEFVGLESVQVASFDTVAGPALNASTSAELTVIGTAGQVFFLAGDLAGSAFLGGFVDSRNSLLIEVDDPSLIQPSFTEDTFVPAAAPGPTVDVDVRLGSLSKGILATRGVIRVGIHGSETFDALQIDPETLKFGPRGAAARAWLSEGRDINRDGFPDLVAVFRASDTGIECGDTAAELTGRTYLAAPFNGTGSFETIGCPRENHRRLPGH